MFDETRYCIDEAIRCWKNSIIPAFIFIVALVIIGSIIIVLSM